MTKILVGKTPDPPQPPTPKTRAELDQIKCAHGCDDHPIILHSRCHFESPTWATYDRTTGSLTIVCATCQQPVITIAVESRFQ